jgi:hypothetical protein
MSGAANFIARRSNSSTSLAQFYKENNNNINPSLSNHDGELDFCNAFWGEGDAGYEVISARLRASNRTVDDLKTFWKERYEFRFRIHENALLIRNVSALELLSKRTMQRGWQSSQSRRWAKMKSGTTAFLDYNRSFQTQLMGILSHNSGTPNQH